MSTPDPLRISAISFLNTKPLLSGLQDVFQHDPLEISLAVPSECAVAFFSGRADVALVPVGALPGHDEMHLLDDYCIGAHDRVDSVLLVSNQPIEQASRIYLDANSASSNSLARLLFRYHWKREVAFIQTPEADNLAQLEDGAAAIVIGDRALAAREKYPHVLDLASAWHQHMGLPFVFAVWVYNPERVSAEQRDRLRIGMRTGLRNLPKVAEEFGPQYGMKPGDALRYFTQSLDYSFDTAKKYAITQFLDKWAKMEGKKTPLLRFA